MATWVSPWVHLCLKLYQPSFSNYKSQLILVLLNLVRVKSLSHVSRAITR